MPQLAEPKLSIPFGVEGDLEVGTVPDRGCGVQARAVPLIAPYGDQVFDQVFILTSGGPARSTETIVYRIYTEAFGNGKLGYASALSYVLLIMTLIVGLIQLYTNNKHEKEEIA